ncbi:MAG: hypothetical protein WAP51_05145 [Candidatus Sungiibacteriota bacterium]
MYISTYELWMILRHLAATSAIAFGVLWLIFKFYRNKYEMDVKSQAMISLKTFGAFILINFVLLFWFPAWLWSRSVMPPFLLSIGVSFFIAQKLLVKAGMENKKEALKITLPWFCFMLAIALGYMSAVGII